LLLCSSAELEAKSEEALNLDGNADKYFDILQAACESKQARLMEIGLDATHSLIGKTAQLIIALLD
jgi:hypothetical protein